MVGWDGAAWDLAAPLMAEGRLPNLAGLVARGRTADLESTAIPISSAAWTTATTGLEPGETGIYSFLQPVEGSYEPRLVSARDNRGVPLWRILSARGRDVIVWGVPLTWPPEPVRGVMVSGMLSPLDDVWTHPAPLTQVLSARGMVPDLGIWRDRTQLTPQRLASQLALKEKALLDTFENRDWSFALVVFKNLDVLSHRAYTPNPRGEVAALMERLDRTLGALIEAAGPNANVVVMSDHGFHTYPRVFDVDTWLEGAGFAVRRDDAVLEPGATGPLAEARVLQRGARLGRLDMARTRAYADAAEGGFCAIRLNVEGREAEGSVAADERDGVIDALEGALGEIRDADGAPVVRTIWRGAELYPGPEQERVVPDLVVELEDGWRAVAQGLGPALQSAPRSFPEHDRTGILVAAGPAIAHSKEREAWRMRDVAPFALRLMGETIPTTMQGDPHHEALIDGKRLLYIDAIEDPSLRSTEEAFEGLPEPGESQAVRERIGVLGYGR